MAAAQGSTTSGGVLIVRSYLDRGASTLEGRPPGRLVGTIEDVRGFIQVAQERDPPDSPGEYGTEGYLIAEQLDSFAQAILTNGRPTVDGAEGLANTKLLLQAASADTFL